MTEIFKCFIKDRLKLIVMWSVYVALTCLILILYGMDKSAVSYSVLLCAVIFFIYLLADLYSYTRKYNMRMKLKNEVLYNLDECMERADTEVEKQYLEIIRDILDKDKKKESYFENKMHEHEEYIMMWAHQIKTPITAMNLILQTDMEDVKESLNKKLFEVEEYVEMMLQYTRIDSINADMELSENNLLKIVKDVVRYFSKIFISKKLSVKIDVKDDILVRTDEKWIVFVLKQILSNALKYTKEGFISIYVEEDNSEGVTLVVEDTGCGISEDNLPRIFEKAFTGYNGHIDRKATGIGLYMTKQILDKLGHRIWVESVVDKGTKVHIRFQNWDDSVMAD